MRRSEIFALMTELGMRGMKAAYDEVAAAEGKHKRGPEWVLGSLLQAEVADKQARSIKCQMTIARLPHAKDLAEFDFSVNPVEQDMVRRLADGTFIEAQRNCILIGGTGNGKSHLAVAIARSCIRNGARGRFFNVIELANMLEREHDDGRQGRLADAMREMVNIGETLFPGPFHPRPNHLVRDLLRSNCPSLQMGVVAFKTRQQTDSTSSVPKFQTGGLKASESRSLAA